MTPAAFDHYSLDDQLGHLLRRVYQRAAASFMEITEALVTPMQYAVLARLWETEQVSQNELGRLAAMDPPTVHGVVGRLRARGLITSRRDPVDRRLILYQLSPAGRRLVRRLMPLEQASTARTLAALTQAQRHQLIELLRRVGWEPSPAVPMGVEPVPRVRPTRERSARRNPGRRRR